ncbi:hypothetical protein NDU88_001436 [Pleurodeles waltl]|uniref:Uncharacterized protein n=1 Tax=Pleurodeles waltl TaxID=8319 RepID=A0AAV7KYL5_PLEWA|nr:hypothetical protein NDU88_001436 [Pleurodeles waltl]
MEVRGGAEPAPEDARITRCFLPLRGIPKLGAVVPGGDVEDRGGEKPAPEDTRIAHCFLPLLGIPKLGAGGRHAWIVGVCGGLIKSCFPEDFHLPTIPSKDQA